jgi:hypothetical protein
LIFIFKKYYKIKIIVIVIIIEFKNKEKVIFS